MNIYSNCQYIILPVTSYLSYLCLFKGSSFNLALTLQLLSKSFWHAQNLSASSFYTGKILSMVTALLLPGIQLKDEIHICFDSLLPLSERGRRLCSHTKKSGSSRTLQRKAAHGELHFIHFLGFQLAAPTPG